MIYSFYLDSLPLANDTISEDLEFMVVGVISDEEVTLQSDIFEAVFAR